MSELLQKSNEGEENKSSSAERTARSHLDEKNKPFEFGLCFFLQITEHEYLICCQPHRHSTTRAETIRIADKRRFDPFAADGCVSVWQQHIRVCEIVVGAAKTIDSFFFF